MRWAKNILLFFCIRRLKPRRERPNNSTGIPGFEEGKKAFRTFYSREGGGVNDCPCVAALTRKASLQRNNGSDRRERPCSGTLSFHPILLSSTQARRFDRHAKNAPPLELCNHFHSLRSAEKRENFQTSLSGHSLWTATCLFRRRRAPQRNLFFSGRLRGDRSHRSEGGRSLGQKKRT